MIRDGEVDPDSFGERVRSTRQRLRGSLGKRWTQGDLAAAVGVERNTVSRWENGGILPKDPAVLAALARTLCVSTDWLLDGFAPAAGDARVGASSGIANDGKRRAALNEHPGADGYFPPDSRALAAVPVAAADLLRDYVTRLRASGCSVGQVRGAAALLLAGATNTIVHRPLRDRDEAEVLADVDAAWDFVTRVLRREGIRL